MKTAITTILISLAIGVSAPLAIGTGTAFAEGPAAAAATQAPATESANPPAGAAAMTGDQKKVISQACSQQANEAGLHGKDRQKFRTACKRNGGKVVAKSAPKAS